MSKQPARLYETASSAVMHRYSAVAVQKEINKDKRIGKREAKRIHALLKGRRNGWLEIDLPNGGATL